MLPPLVDLLFWKVRTFVVRAPFGVNHNRFGCGQNSRGCHGAVIGGFAAIKAVDHGKQDSCAFPGRIILLDGGSQEVFDILLSPVEIQLHLRVGIENAVGEEHDMIPGQKIKLRFPDFLAVDDDFLLFNIHDLIVADKDSQRIVILGKICLGGEVVDLENREGAVRNLTVGTYRQCGSDCFHRFMKREAFKDHLRNDG